MKNLIFFSFIIFVTFSFSQIKPYDTESIAEAERKSSHKLISFKANPNTQNYDVLYHELRFTVDPAVYRISGVVKSRFKALSNMTTVVFDLTNNLIVSGVKENGSNVTFSQSATELTINLTSTLTAGNQTTVEITYSGEPSPIEKAFTTGNHTGTPVLYTLSEPYGARDWWPCKQDLNDKIENIDIYITAPSQYVSVSNGLEQSQTVNGSNKTTHFKHNYPIPAYLVAIAVTNYQIINQQAGTTAAGFFPIVNYLYPETITNGTQDLNTTPDIMNFFESILEPYPFRKEKYGHAQFGWGGGMEHTTVSFMGSFPRDLIAHELAHQWFGDKITCGSWKDIWLNEGLTEYMSGLVVNNFDGENAFINWKNNKINSITMFPSGYVYLQDPDLSSVGRIFSYRLTYNKGSMVTHMLKWVMGDANFFKGLKNYLANPNHAYKYAVTSEFKSIMEAAHGSSLTEFFNDWIYGQGHPSYTVTTSNIGAGQAKIKVSQTTSFPSSVPFFEMPIEVRLKDSAGASMDYRLIHSSNDQEFVVNVPFVVTAVDFDPKKHIISKDNLVTLNNTDNFVMEEAIYLFPNPSQNEIELKLPNNVKLIATNTYNVVGQKMNTYFDKKIDISQLSNGIYIFEIQTSEGIFNKKVIKK